VRALPLAQWPAADRAAWLDACRPSERLKRGGAASHFAAVIRHDLAQRYSYFLDFLHGAGCLDVAAAAASHVTPVNVERYLARLKERLRSVTVHISIYRLRRMAQLIAPHRDWGWLVEIEKDFAFVMQPQSKLDRLVLTEVLVEAGLMLCNEAETASHLNKTEQARMVRNGLMVALLALCPIRLKNFAALELGRTILNIHGAWWIVLPAAETKSRRRDERQVPPLLKDLMDRYVDRYRPILGAAEKLPARLWVSSPNGRPLCEARVAQILSETTLSTIGKDISPHLFRASAASSAAIYGGSVPHLASAILQHRDPRITNGSYNRASTMQAAQAYSQIISTLREQ
jgi:integrase